MLGALLLAVVPLAVVSEGASAAPPAPAVKPSSVVMSPVRLTLLTGDTVVYARDGSGRASVTVDLAPGRETLTYRAQQDKRGYYVFPSDVQPYVGAGLLDKELFNLDSLAAGGGAKGGDLGLIVQYQDQVKDSEIAGKVRALKGGQDPLVLKSIDGAALKVDKEQAGAFWESIRGEAPSIAKGRPATADPALGAGLRKVWLDARVKTLDDVSNPQIGAPTAWAAGFDGTGAEVGIIDTGVDDKHPDLRDRIAAVRNFVPEGNPGGGDPDVVTDRHGHGTHVAAIVAGSGAASGGRYKGVAPGARLSIAKALDDSGSGQTSEIIAAMQWQAETRRVRVVSMSLGGSPTDGTDPLSQAANELTAEHGTLFVVAAGNSGPDRSTVAAPGAATAALTVGAVDGADRVADFSSRGPRVGDVPTIKPEITAPGVRIIAARAAGTAMGGPVDDHYTAASGTSMATPHVAAAAGIMAAKHPGWTPEQLKTALVATAQPLEGSPYDLGAGRLDVGRAVTQHVFGDLSEVSAKFVEPYDGQTLTRRVTYRNTGEESVTLALSVALAHGDAAAPDGMATVTPSSLTIPAGGTAEARLTIEPTVGAAGWYAGRLTASGGTERLTAPIAFHKGARYNTLKVRLVGDPKWSRMYPTVSFSRMNDTDPLLDGEPLEFQGGQWRATDTDNTWEQDVRLPHGGVYSAITQVLGFAVPDREPQHHLMIEPELRLDGDATVTFDWSGTKPIQFATPRPSEANGFNMMYTQSAASGRQTHSGLITVYEGVRPSGFFVSPTRAPSLGGAVLNLDQIRRAAQVRLTVAGQELDPYYATDRLDAMPKFATDRRLTLARGGNLRGKLAYVTGEAPEEFLAGVDAAVAAGAAGVLAGSHMGRVMSVEPYVDHAKIPVISLGKADIARVEAALAGKSSLRADLKAELTNPYEYKLASWLRGGVPGNLSFTVKPSELAQIDTTYHAQFAPPAGRHGPGTNASEVNHHFGPGVNLSYRASINFAIPASRTEYYSVLAPDLLWQRGYQFSDTGAAEAMRIATSNRGFPRPVRETEHWNEPLVPSRAAVGPDTPANFDLALFCDTCRQGDRLRLRTLSAAGLGYYADASDPSHSYQGAPGTEETRLFSGDRELTPETDQLGLPYYTVPAGEGVYRLTNVFKDGFTGRHGGTSVDTSWTFRSARPAAGKPSFPCLDGKLFGDRNPCAELPLIQLVHRLGLPADDTVRAGRPFTFTFDAKGGVGRSTRLRVWTSADQGAHWTPAVVVPGLGTTHRVVTRHPDTPGTVSIRTEAADSAGNSVRQTIVDAYKVK
ncbi:S8 family serine peptidase [Nonomuraea cavernae]|uniref:S8 family serine peptidase n=1 Tax=Nonomuraea cavernae TaxID=2045107 RepID=UPI00166C2696|nr:S8 family serine peptidase [Nonomuraea cavernae]MCA2187568.1 S8 family serine peptidase [Nonomuraea cavernae]